MYTNSVRTLYRLYPEVYRHIVQRRSAAEANYKIISNDRKVRPRVFVCFRAFPVRPLKDELQIMNKLRRFLEMGVIALDLCVLMNEMS